MFARLSEDLTQITALSAEKLPGMVDLDAALPVGGKCPNGSLYFMETAIDARAATVGSDGKVYIIDPSDNKIKRFNDIADPDSAEVGVSWDGLGTPIQIRVTSKGIVVFSAYANPARVYYMPDIHTAPTVVHEEFDSGWTKDYGVDVYDNGIDVFVFAASYNTSATPPNAILSKDGGQTFTVVKTAKPQDPPHNNHFHDVVIDPYSGWLWLSEGDVTNADVWYSVDLGATWKALDLEPFRQPTAMLAFPERILMGRDDWTLRAGLDAFDKPVSSVDMLDLGSRYKPLKVVRNDIYSAQMFARSPVSRGNEGHMRFEGGGGTILVVGTGDGGKSAHVVGFGPSIRGLFGMDAHRLYGFSVNQQRIIYAQRLTWG